MKHVELFKSFFDEIGRGTAREIHEYLKKHNAVFNCKSGKISDEVKSVNRQIGMKVGKLYPTGYVMREKNANGIFEYFLGEK